MGCIWATVRAREGGPIAFPAGGLSIGVPYAAPEPLVMLRWPRTAVAEPRAHRGAFVSGCDLYLANPLSAAKNEERP